MFSFNIERGVLSDLITGATGFASTDKWLPTLNSVQFEIDGGTLIVRATNRFVAIRGTGPIKDHEGENCQFMVSLDDLKLWAKCQKRNRRNEVSIKKTEDRGPIAIMDGLMGFATHVTDASDHNSEFPSLDKLILDSPSEHGVHGSRPAFNAKYLALLSKVPTATGNWELLQAEDREHGSSRPMFFMPVGAESSRVQWVAMVMPVRPSQM